MSFEEIADILLKAKRPIDVFGDVDIEEIKKTYKRIMKICHPDIVESKYKTMAEQITVLLNDFYKRAQEEFEKGIYNSTDEKEILEADEPVFEFTLKGKVYKFYKYYESEDVCDVYEGIVDGKLVLLKVASDEKDNDLVTSEYEVLSELEHASIPKVITKVKLNEKMGLIIEKPKGLTIDELKKQYGNIPPNHVCWMLERLLSAIGYLHSNKIVHGNIKPENIIIDLDTHNVVIKDYSLCVREANENGSKYKIVNEDYTPPSVDANARVKPNTDIYAVGKIAINLIGGDIKRVALPLSCDERVRVFIRKLLSSNQNDAWELWDELIQLRNDVYGTQRFQKLERKK